MRLVQNLGRYSASTKLAIAWMVATGCSDAAHTRLGPAELALAEQMVEANGRIRAFPSMADSIASVRVTPRVLSDAELEAEVADARGRVLIALKAVSSPRAFDAGRTSAINREDALRVQAMLRSEGVAVERTFRYSNMVVARLRPGVASQLLRLPFVDFIEADARLYPQSLTSSQDTSWGVHRLRLRDVWLGTYGPSTRGEWANITILDTGMDYTHRFLGDGPEGLVLDCLYVEGTGNCYDYQWGHGVHVGGIIAGRDNERGYIGVAYNPSSFASVRVCEDTGAGPECLASNIIAGLEWTIAVGRPRHIVNMSLGLCQYSAALHSTVQQASAAGLLLIASAGNAWAGLNACGTHPPGATGVMYPARWSEVMAVSGIREDDSFADPPAPPPGGYVSPYSPGGDCGGGNVCGTPPSVCMGSRSGAEVEIAAPHWAVSMKSNGRYDSLCGTSMASAVVSGVAALLWSRNTSWTAAQVRNRLRATAVPLGDARKFGSGRVDPVNAIYSCAPPTPLSATVLGSSVITQPGWHVWTASVAGGACPGGFPYVHSWSYSESEFGQYSIVGTSSTIGRTVDESSAPEFWLRYTVSNFNEHYTTQVHVINSVTNPCGPWACVIAPPATIPRRRR